VDRGVGVRHRPSGSHSSVQTWNSMAVCPELSGRWMDGGFNYKLCAIRPAIDGTIETEKTFLKSRVKAVAVFHDSQATIR